MGRLWVERENGNKHGSAEVRIGPGPGGGRVAQDDCVSGSGGSGQFQPGHEQKCRDSGSLGRTTPGKSSRAEQMDAIFPNTDIAVRRKREGW